MVLPQPQASLGPPCPGLAAGDRDLGCTRTAIQSHKGFPWGWREGQIHTCTAATQAYSPGTLSSPRSMGTQWGPFFCLPPPLARAARRRSRRGCQGPAVMLGREQDAALPWVQRAAYGRAAVLFTQGQGELRAWLPAPPLNAPAASVILCHPALAQGHPISCDMHTTPSPNHQGLDPTFQPAPETQVLPP